MKTPIRKNGSRGKGFLFLLLSLLGLTTTSCVMYGSPTADFAVKGKVIDENGNAIPDLQIVLGQRYYDSAVVTYDRNYDPLDTLKTGSDGIYRMSSRSGLPVEILQVDVNDIDGEAGGGRFESASIIIKDIPYKGGHGAWYEGEAYIEVPDIKLKKK